MSLPPSFPLAAIVGADDLKLALCLVAVDPKIGGVLIEGPRGMAKSTLARGIADLLDGRFVTLPLGATEERITGSLDLDAALGEGQVRFSPGLLARADQGVLYVDEVNLLPDPLVDILLDAAASGLNHVERDGLSRQHPARFLLVGTMNPEEGELRPQLLDRFAFSLALERPPEPAGRAEIVRRRLAFDQDPAAFVQHWAAASAALRQQCQQARQRLAAIALDEASLEDITRRCFAARVDGLRADLVWLRAARAYAAWRGDSAIRPEDIDRVEPFVLRHRRQAADAMPLPDSPSPAPASPVNNQESDGQWGALPACNLPAGPAPEVPHWPKKP